MKHSLIFAATALVVCLSAAAADMNGQLPMYPHARNVNGSMSKAPPGMTGLMVLESDDAVNTVDAWYAANAPKSCARSSASGGTKFACRAGSIMIYAHGGKTQIAYVPAMALMGH
jgi:hypothetical protein